MIKAVITDIDGTLCDYVGISWVRFLGANKYIKDGLFEEHENLVDAYRTGLLDHVSFTREWVNLYGNIIKGSKVSDIDRLAKKFFKGFKKGMPEQSAKIIEHFKKKKYLVVAITASPEIPVNLVAQHFRIDKVYATIMEIRNGRYTGEVMSTMHMNEYGKENIVRSVIMEHGIDTSHSFALGDTIHDLPLLESVAYPIAINPKGKLREYAVENGFWTADYNTITDVVEMVEKSDIKSVYEEMKFIYEIGILRYIPRSGWAHIQVENPENVAEHTFRTSVIAYLLAVEEGADPYKCAFAALAHDIAEARMGDINKITANYIEKEDGEDMAFKDMIARLDVRKRKELMRAWKCFDDMRICEICKDADLLENLVTAREYEYKGYKNAREWIIRITNKLKTGTAKKWAKALQKMDPNSWWFGIKSLAIR
ncbi:MAG: HAD-IB family phosphatase [Candidatus Micrarchaeia archaeon]